MQSIVTFLKIYLSIIGFLAAIFILGTLIGSFIAWRIPKFPDIDWEIIRMVLAGIGLISLTLTILSNEKD